jgi:hypothetical protein
MPVLESLENHYLVNSAVRGTGPRFISVVLKHFCAIFSEVMDIPKTLVSEAEEAIKMKLKPILDQAQV